MSYDGHMLLALANLVVCGGIVWACLCRLNAMEGRATRTLYRVTYSVLLGAATAQGLAPQMFDDWPGASDLLFSAAVLLVLCVGSRNWRTGPPEYARAPKRPGTGHTGEGAAS